MAIRILLLGASILCMLSCGPTGNAPRPVSLTPATAPGPSTEEIRQLVQKIEGYSERETDVPVTTPADSAAAELTRIGKPVAPYLLEALKSTKPWARVHSMEILASLREAAAVQPMLTILKQDPDHGVRPIAAYNLGSFHDPAALPDLRAAARSKDINMARSAWHSLGEMKDEGSIPLLVERLGTKASFPHTGLTTDPYPIEALVAIGLPAVKPLGIALKHRRGEAQRSAAIALGQIGSDAAFETLKESSKSPSSRRAAFAGLFDCKREEIKPIAIEALKDQELVLDAEEYLTHHPDLASAQPLIRILDGRYPESVRIGAATALGHMRGKSVVDALKRNRHDPSHYVRVAIVESLARLGESTRY